MKTTRTTKVVLLVAVAIVMLGWLASEFTTPPKKARASRINTTHNIVTMSVTLPGSASTQSTAAPSTTGQR